MAVEKAFSDSISGGLQNFKPVEVWYASDIVLIDLNATSRWDSTTYGRSNFSKNGNPH